MNSVEKALTALESFTMEKPTYTLTEMAKKLGVSKGTAHRILLTAQKCGFVEQEAGTNRYQLGLKVFELGSVVAKRMDLRNQSLPVLKEIADQTGETAHLIIVYQDEALCLERIEGHNFLRVLFLEVGKRMPLHIGAGPKVLLAHLPESEFKRISRTKGLSQWTEYTVRDLDELRQDLARIREQGYALSMEDATKGAAAVGAPIRNATGEVIGAISLAGASVRFKGRRLKELIRVTMEAGMEISRRMGYSGQQ